jgi:uncharacterized protein YfaT (DUF1175 family)
MWFPPTWRTAARSPPDAVSWFLNDGSAMMRVRLTILGAGAAVVLGLLWANSIRHATTLDRSRVSVRPAQLIADGDDVAMLTIIEPSDAQPRIIIEPTHAATVAEIFAIYGGWVARIRAGVTPANLTLRVEAPGFAAAQVHLFTTLAPADSAADGTPDFLRLDDTVDQSVFRRWFAFLAEAQYFQPAARRPAEITDCAALIRYAYREALRAHDSRWAGEAQLPVVPALPSVTKYQYPYTPLGADLFRVKPGSFQSADLGTGAFAQFADAKTLQLRNTHFVTRDPERAEPGDLLFYRQASEHMPFHSMIYLGASQIEKDSGRYLVYHTGPDRGGPGEMRRPTLDELRRFPEPDWRPLPDNPRFLGVYRWNILRSITQ